MTTVNFTATGDGASHAPFTVDGSGGDRVYVFTSAATSISLHNPNASPIVAEVYYFYADGTYGGFLGNFPIGAADGVSIGWITTDAHSAAIVVNLHSPIAAPLEDWHLSLTYGPDPTAYCAYGIERNPDAAVYTVVTAAVIDVIAVLLGLGPLGVTALDAMIGAPLIGPTCAAGPPVAPTFTTDDFLFGTGIPSPSGLSKLPALLASGVWHFYCHCTPAPPGSPAPTEFVPPDYSSSPIGTADQPTPTCDAEDICTYLNQLSRMLNAMSLQLRAVREDVTLIQRQHVPFAYVPGPAFSALSGQGATVVPAILALSVTCTTIPTHLGLVVAEPTAHLFLGEITLATPDGWTDRIRLTRSPQMIFEIPAYVGTIGYSFEPGVVATIATFVREP